MLFITLNPINPPKRAEALYESLKKDLDKLSSFIVDLKIPSRKAKQKQLKKPDRKKAMIIKVLVNI